MEQEILKGFIVIEGLDGAGTTTQSQLLMNLFFKAGITCYGTHEPTGSAIGKFIRDVLSGKVQAEQSSIAYLFAADRNEHMYNKDRGIKRKLEDTYEYVVCDRYLWSSIAYQSIGCGKELITDLNKNFPLPEHLIFLDTPVKMCQERLNSRNAVVDIYDKLEYQIKVKKNYEDAFKEIDSRVHITIIDGSRPKEIIANDILDTIIKHGIGDLHVPTIHEWVEGAINEHS